MLLKHGGLAGPGLLLAGQVNVTGVVEQIDFTRTIVRHAHCCCCWAAACRTRLVLHLACRNDIDIPVSIPNKVRHWSSPAVSVLSARIISALRRNLQLDLTSLHADPG